MEKILLIEDDRDLNIGLTYDLETEGYLVYSARSLSRGMMLLDEQDIDLILLDGNLPDGDGFAFCRAVKQERELPVILLTARDMDRDELKGFEAGADDYIKKPFKLPILYKRIEVALRNYGAKENSLQYNDGFLMIDFGKMTAKKDGEMLELTAREFKLLSIFLMNEGQVITKSMFLQKIWDSDGNFVDEHVVPVNINRLRAKLEDDTHKYIKTMYGMGYQWKRSEG